MPMTGFQNGILVDGLLKDFGDALARELGLAPRYLTLPRKRVEGALRAGQADLLCDIRPEWLLGKDWLWTGTVFSNNMIIGSRIDTRPLARLSDLAGERVGTVLGYVYPRVEAPLGGRFLRDDAATDDINTAKLLSARFRYMISNSLYYEYQRKEHPEGKRLNPQTFIIRQFDTFCALAPAGRLDVNTVNRAILALRERGDLQRIHNRYRVLQTGKQNAGK